MEQFFTLDQLEALYLTQYDADTVMESTGDEVQDFLQWCRENVTIEQRKI